MTQPIGILGGTFDPIHNGHLHLAKSCLEKLKFSELRFIPLNKPSHRPRPSGTPEQRLAMLELIVEDHELLKIDDFELRSDGISYTIDTLKWLRGCINDTPLCMLIGMDNLQILNSWKQWRSLLNYAHIVIADRPFCHADLDDEIRTFVNDFITTEEEDLHRQPAGYIMKLDIPMLDVSSTQIRNNFLSGSKSESLLPDKVLDFIQANHLYNRTMTT